MAAHNRDARFKGIGFDMTIIEESTEKDYIEKREGYWVGHYDSYKNGLNRTATGAGWGHEKRARFTTENYVYSEASRAKMSKSAKRRAEAEGSTVRSERARAGWKRKLSDPTEADRVRERNRRAGAAHRKIDKTVILDLWMKEHEKYVDIKSANGRVLTAMRQFANEYASRFGVTGTALYVTIKQINEHRDTNT